jgi:hypothetical protein
LLDLDLREIDRLVDAELALHAGDAVLRGLREVETGATRRTQL